MRGPLSFLFFPLVLLLCLPAAGCAPRDHPGADGSGAEAGRAALARRTAPHTVTESPAPYLRGRPVPLGEDREDPPLLRRQVSLRQRGTLRDLAASLSRAAGIPVLVAESDPPAPGTGTEAFPAADDLFPGAAGLAGEMDVRYSGPLKGLLENLAALSGYGWDCEGDRVVFSAMQLRTFVLTASAGELAWESQVSSRSRDQQSGSGPAGSGVGAQAVAGDASSQTAQVNGARLSLDVWREAERAVKSLLSRGGTVSLSQSAGTIAVRDTWARLRDIDRCLRALNARLERQAALCVRVWALETDDASTASLNLQTLFSDGDLAVRAGSPVRPQGGLASVSVLRGRLRGSEAMAEAMGRWGRVTQLTSASGLVMNNQPFPVQAVRRRAYLAGMTLSTSEYSQTSEITPGEVTTGFAMTIVPHILPDGRVLLQYTLTLSSLDEMTTIEKGRISVQLPQVSTRAFSQRTRLMAGQTLVLAGFEQDTARAARSLGLLSARAESEGGRTLLIVSIELEGADNV